jgi:hypothetical protein
MEEGGRGAKDWISQTVLMIVSTRRVDLVAHPSFFIHDCGKEGF